MSVTKVVPARRKKSLDQYRKMLRLKTHFKSIAIHSRRMTYLLVGPPLDTYVPSYACDLFKRAPKKSNLGQYTHLPEKNIVRTFTNLMESTFYVANGNFMAQDKNSTYLPMRRNQDG